jgi:hypothetical protein
MEVWVQIRGPRGPLGKPGTRLKGGPSPVSQSEILVTWWSMILTPMVVDFYLDPSTSFGSMMAWFP